jgi:hypothetical protein
MMLKASSGLLTALASWAFAGLPTVMSCNRGTHFRAVWQMRGLVMQHSAYSLKQLSCHWGTCLEGIMRRAPEWSTQLLHRSSSMLQIAALLRALCVAVIH